jgi:hypothetical protein
MKKVYVIMIMTDITKNTDETDWTDFHRYLNPR